MSIIGIKNKIVSKGASYSSESARGSSIDGSIDLQSQKMGAQDSSSSTEESLGVNKADSFPDSRPPQQRKRKEKVS